MAKFMYLLSGTSAIVGSGTGTAEATNNTAQATGGFMSNPIMMIIVYCVVIFGALYFFSIRPQKKREAEAEAMRAQIKVGDSVLLNNGMYGVISDITAECYIIEFGTNKGIRIPVLKQEVALVRTPNLSNKEPEPVVEEKPKKSFLGLGKKED